MFGPLTKTSLRIRNFLAYWREIGLKGTLTLLRQRAEGREVFELPVRGLRTPVLCRAAGSDFAVLRQVLGHQDSAISLDRPAELVIDAGANVGYSSLLFSMRYPGATIVAIEPDCSNCEVFAKNCGHYGNIHLITGAVWHESAPLTISNPSAAAFEFQVSEASAEAPVVVQGYTLTEIIRSFGGRRVSLLKLDIEGAEWNVFTQGSRDWLSMVDNLIVELHDRLVPGCTAALDALVQDIPHTREQRGEYVHIRLLPSHAA